MQRTTLASSIPAVCCAIATLSVSLLVTPAAQAQPVRTAAVEFVVGGPSPMDSCGCSGAEGTSFDAVPPHVAERKATTTRRVPGRMRPTALRAKKSPVPLSTVSDVERAIPSMRQGG